MATPVRDEPPPAPAEELVLGPRCRRLPHWFAVAVLGLGLLILAAAAAWALWPRPVGPPPTLEPLSLAELQDTYAGMVRADGTNDASVLTRETVVETPVSVSPPDCSPLVQATMANQFPDAALDGVGTYWLGQRSTISLFTLRFPDAGSADAELTRIQAALDDCVDRELVVRRSSEIGRRGLRAAVGRTTARAGHDQQPDPAQLGYVLSGPDGLLAIQLMPYLNTLTWQFRYETGSSTYSPQAADQLMQGLRAQLGSVIAARAR